MVAVTAAVIAIGLAIGIAVVRALRSWRDRPRSTMPRPHRGL